MFEPRLFGGADDEDRTPDTGVFMDAIRDVCRSAISERKLPALEMAEEFVPFFGLTARGAPADRLVVVMKPL